MRGITRVGLDINRLTDEEIEYIEKQIVKTVRPILIGRTLFPAVPVGSPGFRKSLFYSETDMSAAVIDMDGQEESMDDVKLAKSEVKVPVIHKEFRLLWRDIALARDSNMALDVSFAENAARQVAEEEDKLLISGSYTGWEALGIEGLTTATGRQTSAGGDWSVNYLTYVNAAIALLETYGFYGPYKLLLTPTWRAQLRQLISNTEKWAFQAVGELIGGVENILVSNSLYAADGGVDSVVLCQPGPENFDMHVGLDLQTITKEEKNGNIWGTVREVIAPRVKRPKSIVEITTLT